MNFSTVMFRCTRYRRIADGRIQELCESTMSLLAIGESRFAFVFFLSFFRCIKFRTSLVDRSQLILLTLKFLCLNPCPLLQFALSKPLEGKQLDQNAGKLCAARYHNLARSFEPCPVYLKDIY